MGKKGSWFSAIKRAFTPNSSSKDKQINGTEKKTSQEKKKGRRILRHGDFKSFIPLFREPSSIEKILEEADEQKLLVPLYYEQQSFASERPKSPPRISSPRASSFRDVSPRYSPPRASSPRVKPPETHPFIVSSPQAASPRAISSKNAFPKETSPKTASPKETSSETALPSVTSSVVNENRNETSNTRRPEPTLQVLHLSATTIQAVFRGYVARKSFISLRGLLRLQEVVKGNNVKRQTSNAMKKMQLLVRVQTQVRSRRIQKLENQTLQWQAYKNDKDGESTLSKHSHLSEAGNNENWDNSMLTKDEVDQRWQKKVEAVMKRERSIAYAHSHKLGKANPKSTMNIQSNGFPWWKWLEHQLPSSKRPESQHAVTNVHQTPSRAISECKPSPLPQTTNYRYACSEYGSQEADTPTSTKSAIPMRSKPFHTPINSILRKYTRSRDSASSSPFQFPSKDDDSLTSCPPFSVPNYMAPTISAKAKVRQGNLGTPSSGAMRRLTFPLTPNIGSFKWVKGSSKGAASLREFDRSVDGVSVGSAVSMPAIVGRKPFNRFV